MNDDLKKIYEELQNDIKETMINEVATEVIEIQNKHVEEDVYNAYRRNLFTGEICEPFIYERRREQSGGLLDANNTIVKFIEDQLVIQNIARGKNQNIPLVDLIENGQNNNQYSYQYLYNRDGTMYQYLQARPFIANTLKELNKKEIHIKAFKNGMKNKGWNIE